MKAKIIILSVIFIALSLLSVAIGSTDISLHDILGSIFGSDGVDAVTRRIVLEYRIPQSVTAIMAGGSLAVAGLMLQTAFRNPLAGPSILGVSTGASLGVAVATMVLGGASSAWIAAASISGALIGAFSILVLILVFSIWLRSNTMLLIIGIMLGYVASSAISLLQFFAPSQAVKNFAVWGMGSFSNMQVSQLPVFISVCVVGLILSLLLIKPLNALLLGDNYAENLGINVKRSRNLILAASGLLTAIVTTYCGPVAFVGLAVPHVARIIFGSSNHRILLPVNILLGAIVALACCIISVAFPSLGVLPVNAITPVFGAPVIIYVVIRMRSHS